MLLVSETNELMNGVFAPWIVDLGVEATAFDDTGGDFRLRDNPALVHVGGVVCGQAIASAADTACIIALTAHNGRFRICTTVDFSVHFIRPVPPGATDMRMEILSNGKRMAYTRVEFRAEGSKKLAATVTGAFAYLED